MRGWNWLGFFVGGNGLKGGDGSGQARLFWGAKKDFRGRPIENLRSVLQLLSTAQASTIDGVPTMSAPSLAPYILARPWLKRWVMPIAKWYANAAGYRRLGLR